jgi:flavin reductase (DIM6/NTAB) family NADH-FMN oxidoreductase RutF
MIFDPETLDRRTLHGLLTGLILPRPIAWVSTVSADGQPNLAPFSYFNAFSAVPPVVAIGPGSRKGVNKDTLRNVRETGEFVVSVVTEDLADLCNATSAEFGPEVSEWDAFGIEGTDSVEVAPQRVAASPAAFECRVMQIVDLSEGDQRSNAIVIGRVLRIHVDDAALDGTKPRSEVLRLVGRMGGREWCRTRDTFEMIRPSSTDPAEIRQSLEANE